MEFRYNEIIVWLIPGLYFLCLMFLFILLPITGDGEIVKYINSIKDLPEGVQTSAALFFIPFVSFVVGYLINYIASQSEFVMYKFNILQRPSKILLSGKSDRYRVADLRLLEHKLSYSSNNDITNDEANKLLIKTKQNVDISSLDTYYFKSVFGRNLLCSQVLIIIGIIFDAIYFKSLESTGMIVCIAISLLLFASWRRNCKIYTKNILALYLRNA